MKLSVVIPCFNEEKNVAPLYDACVRALEGQVESLNAAIAAAVLLWDRKSRRKV